MPDAGGPPYALTNFPNGLITSAIFLTEGLIATDEDSILTLEGPLHFQGGEITALGEMGIGTQPPPGLYPVGGLHPAGTGWGPDAPEAQLRLGGLFGPTTDPVLLNIQNIYRPGPVMLPHFSDVINLFAVIPYVEPLIAGTISQIVAAAIFPNLSTSATSVSHLVGVGVGWILRTGYTGTISAYTGVNIGGVNPQGVGLVIPNVRGIWIQSIAPNHNLTTGTATQRGITVNPITSGTNGGTNNNYGIELVVPTGVATLGTVVNRGLFISGNGGTATGGTVTNYAIYSTSTAPSLFTGPVIQMPAASVTPANNGEMMVQLTSNTQLTIKVKGSDGTVRSTNLTLA